MHLYSCMSRVFFRQKLFCFPALIGGREEHGLRSLTQPALHSAKRDGGSTVEIDGVYGKGDEIVRVEGVLEAVYDIGKRMDIEPISRTLP